MLEKLAKKAKAASRQVALLSAGLKRRALEKAAARILASEKEILKANAKDVQSARKKNLSPALIDRLILDEKRVQAMARAVQEIAAQKDPVGETVETLGSSAGIRIQKVRVPLGVIVMVYESRPNVTAESAALCLKSGNAVILRGGSEAVHSNTVLAGIFREAIASAGVPRDAVTFIRNTDRKNIYQLSTMNAWVDLVIARGSEAMVNEIRARATVPVLGHGKGVCHVYVDSKADLEMAESIAFNAKVHRPGVCNAAESLLVHRAVASAFLKKIGERFKSAGVELHGCPRTRRILRWARPAAEKNWPTEYLSLAMSVKVVDSLDEAIGHINRYGSGHTDAIVTENEAAAEKFLTAVDSAAVFCNVSTRMHDGGVFGLGAEIGISTQKLHARGTMGAKELTTTKYVARGRGQIRE